MWSKIKKVLGVLTDLLLIGRNKGLWSKDQTIETKKKGK